MSIKGTDRGRRWLALHLLCCGVLLVVIETTIVTVALPSIAEDLQVSGTSVTWILSAYMLAFGGSLLLSGRLADLYERRTLFIAGMLLFTLASLVCGTALSAAQLFAARAIQGVGGALITAVALSLVVTSFTAPADRARAMSVYGFVWAAGGGVGEVLGGLLTHATSWRWIFLFNVPVGLLLCLGCLLVLVREPRRIRKPSVDLPGALLATSAVTLFVYGLTYVNETGLSSVRTLSLLGLASVLLLIFVAIEARVAHPLVPLRALRQPNLRAANLMALLWAAGAMPWFVHTALYLQHALAYGPLEVGYALVPATLIMAVAALGVAGRLAVRFGPGRPLCFGLLVLAAGVGLFARAPLPGTFLIDVLPGMMLQGVGAGVAYTPLLIVAMNDTDAAESGLASGLVNTAFVMGQALGLALLSSLAQLQTASLEASGIARLPALISGYHFAFAASAALIGAAAFLAATAIRPVPRAVDARDARGQAARL